MHKVRGNLFLFALLFLKWQLLSKLPALFRFCVNFREVGCPSSTKVLSCTPKCKQDTDCSAIGGKCCPNLCNERSCIQRNQLDQGNGNSKGGDKYSSGNSGAYCGNIKCSPYEKCEMDRSTKRQKCVRT
uniref:WAP domain-containing protein n=1 Tax=Bactrocera latifrons TaxID=174628 RepID=A0A0K8VYK3_BACLA